MSMQKNAMIGPDTPDLNEPPMSQKQAAAGKTKKTAEELDGQDLLKREADKVKDRLKDPTP